MRKQFLLMLILCFTASMVWAEWIDVATARKVAQTVAQREGAASSLRSASDLPLVYAAAPGQSGTALRSGTMEGAADYFVFNFPGEKGFAIVAGDDRVRPVLGYSDEGSFDPDNLPENFRGMLAYYQDQIAWANNKGIEATPDIAAEWSRYMSGTALRAGGKSVLLETANWNQYDPYNRKTPMFSNEVTEVHAPTGCSATAMGIIMKYYRFPEQANMEKGIASYEGIDISYDKYDWENIPKELNASSSIYEINAVAELLWECGANIHTKYSLGTGCASDENVLNAMRDVFGYSLQMKALDQWLEKYSWEEWKSILRNELDNRHPVLYASSTEQRIDALSGKGHMFVCDGYDSYDRFHFNWGWGGLYNGFYLLSSLDPKNDLVWGGYNQRHRMIINIKPNNPNENTSSILLRSSLYSIGFEYVEWRGGWYGGVEYTIVNGGNTPFEGYYALVSVDQEENIVDILNISGITFLDVFSSSQCLTLKDPNVCIMLAYSSNKQDWVLVRGATPEIACKFKPIEGPISEYPIYYDLDVWGEPQITGIEANVIGKLEYGKVGTIQLTPLEGYSLPKTNEIHMQIGSETIVMGNAPATESFSHYDNIYWDENTGIITIPFVAGPVHIDTRGKQVGSDDEIKDLESTSLSSLTYILNGESYEILLGYWKSFTVILPSDIQASYSPS